VQIVQEAIQAVLGMVAQAKIDSTKAAISATYRKLAQRADYPDIEIDPEKYEVMAVRQGESEVALRILNKGDINCAALSIFLALAGSGDLAHNVGFMILDDPSQSLDPVHRERLADVINDVLKEKQIIVVTSETDFAERLRRKVTKNKRVYALKDWTPDKGPQLKWE
jgi:DNA repair exonuclease SbcCD ATPase subunit